MGTEELESNKPEHYVVPSCERGNFDATEPMKNWRTAWRKLTRAIKCPDCNTIQQPEAVCKNKDCRADIKDLKSRLHGLRFHDLRHQGHHRTRRAEPQRPDHHEHCWARQPTDAEPLFAHPIGCETKSITSSRNSPLTIGYGTIYVTKCKTRRSGLGSY